MPKTPEYVKIASELKSELLAGTYDHEGSLPGSAAVAKRFNVNLKTAGRAIQQLLAEGLLIARPGLRPLIVPPEQRATDWPMSGRYARARSAGGLVFASDVNGEVRKETVAKDWSKADVSIAKLLQVNLGDRVFHRVSHTYVDEKLVEVTSVYFPVGVIERVPQLETDEVIKIVPLLGDAGYTVARTANEIQARLANENEQTLLGLDKYSVVIQQSHGTYSTEDEPLEAVVNVRPAADNRITFDTYETEEAE